MLAVDPPLAVNRPVSLPALLISRECRQARQQARHQCILLVLTLVVPGSVKDNALTRRIFNLGWQALCQRLSEQGWPCLQAAILSLPIGCEGYLALQADAWRVKDCAIQLEMRQPIGRLWDIDVLTREGRILSRRNRGLPERRCLLCRQPAKVCARQRRHASPQLLNEMERIINNAISTG